MQARIGQLNEALPQPVEAISKPADGKPPNNLAVVQKGMPRSAVADAVLDSDDFGRERGRGGGGGGSVLLH